MEHARITEPEAENAALRTAGYAQGAGCGERAGSAPMALWERGKSVARLR